MEGIFNQSINYHFLTIFAPCSLVEMVGIFKLTLWFLIPKCTFVTTFRSFWTDHFYWIYYPDPKPYPLEINLLWKNGRHKDSKSLNQKSFRYKEKVCFSDPWMVGTFVRTPREIVIFVRQPSPSPSNRSILKTTPPPQKKVMGTLVLTPEWWEHFVRTRC